MKKKFLSVVLSIAMFLLLLTGCQSISSSASSEAASSDSEEQSSSSEADQWFYGYLTGIDDASSLASWKGYESGEDAAASIDYFSFDSTSDSSYDIGYEEAYNKYYRRSFLRGYIEGYISICDEIDLDDLFEEISHDLYS